MKKTASIIVIFFIFFISVFSGCDRAQTGNSVSDGGLASFNALVAQNKDRKGFHDALKHWGLSLSDGDKFEWTKDTSANDIDFAMVIAADPFIEAGLDVSKLTDSGYIFKEATTEDGKSIPDLLIHPYNVSNKKETAQGSEDALRRILKQTPELVYYDENHGRYKLNLSDGFDVQWPEMLEKNNAELTFAIAADPLIAAGADIAKLENSGWTYWESESAYPNQLIKTFKLAN